MGAAKFNLNLVDQLAFYGAYHKNFVNQLIHVICVPLIVQWTMVLLSFAPVNVGPALSLVYWALYTTMDWKAGLPYGFFIVLQCSFALVLRSWLGDAMAFNLALLFELVCWSAQFVGHGVFEGRSPALLDNLLQAFLLAPFFVLFHVLFWLGLRKDLEKKLDVAVAKRIAAERRQGKK